MEIIPVREHNDDFLYEMAITIPSGNNAWITPEDYLPSGNYIYNEWIDGDMGLLSVYGDLEYMCSGVVWTGRRRPRVVRTS